LIAVNVERVEELGNEIQNTFKKVSDKYREKTLLFELTRSVIIHEILHSYTDLALSNSPRKILKRSNIPQFYFRVIEEALASYYGLSVLNHNLLGRYSLIRILNDSPLEYRSSITFLTLNSRLAELTLKAWQRMASIGDFIRIIHEEISHTLYVLLGVPKWFLPNINRFWVMTSIQIFLWKLYTLWLASRANAKLLLL